MLRDTLREQRIQTGFLVLVAVLLVPAMLGLPAASGQSAPPGDAALPAGTARGSPDAAEAMRNPVHDRLAIAHTPTITATPTPVAVQNPVPNWIVGASGPFDNAGDVNGDGYDDVIVNDQPTSWTDGSVRIFDGSAAWPQLDSELESGDRIQLAAMALATSTATATTNVQAITGTRHTMDHPPARRRRPTGRESGWSATWPATQATSTATASTISCSATRTTPMASPRTRASSRSITALPPGLALLRAGPWKGNEPNRYLGDKVAAAGDVNKDGCDDIVASGAWSGNPRSHDIYPGSPSGPATAPNWTSLVPI